MDDPVFCEAAKQEGFNIRLICQPLDSSDFNILDLGFFEVFNQFKIQSVLMEAMKVKGCNNFKIPHMKKEILKREDRLPTFIPCEQPLLDEAEATLAARSCFCG